LLSNGSTCTAYIEDSAVVLVLEMMKGSTLLDYVLDKVGAVPVECS
jgi:hypothetical protein